MKQKLLMTLAAGLLLAGCTADRQDGLDGQDGRVPVRLCVSQDAGKCFTRTTSDLHNATAGFAVDETMTVFMKAGTATTSGTYQVQSVTSGTATLTPIDAADALYYPMSAEGSVSLYAVYPAGVTASGTHTVAYDQTADAAYQASDLMYAPVKNVDLANKGDVQTLSAFEHKMVRLKLNLVKAADVTSVTEVKIVNVKRKVSVTALSDEGITLGTAAQATGETGTGANSNEILISSGMSDDSETHYVVFPKQVASGNDWNGTNFLTVTADGQTVTYQLTKAFTAGKAYELTLTVNKAALGTTVNITGWTDDQAAAITPTIETSSVLTIAAIANQTYTGSAITPALTVTKGGVALTKDAENGYTCQWFNNTAVGTASVIVLGQGTNAGAVGYATFEIVAPPLDFTKNPLWWVAQYNMAQDKASFVSEHSTVNQYVFAGSDLSETIADYHVPTRDELISIVPSDKSTDIGTKIYILTGTLGNPTAFSEVACSVGGSSVAASTSWIGKNADYDYYAVRFIGTDYASAWHYKWVTSPCNGLLIESYLVPMANETEAKAVLADLASSTIFTGTVNAESANQTPESTTATINGFTQRFLPACGQNNSGSGIANYRIGEYAACWSQTFSDSNDYGYNFALTAYPSLNILVSSGRCGLPEARPVRPFRDPAN